MKQWRCVIKLTASNWVGIKSIQVLDDFKNDNNWFKDYLQELNDTGSFPDESEKTSMCFMKCYLEAIGVMNSEHKVDKEKTLVMYKLDDDEVIDECSNEVCELINFSTENFKI